MTAGLIGLGIIVGLYLIGRAIGNGGNPSTITVGSNNTDTRDCTELCNQWDNRRQERCNAEKDEGTAQNRVGTLNSQLLAAIAAAATASAALVACLASVFCAPFAPGIAALAAVLWAAVVVTAGQLGSAQADLANKAAAAQNARAAEQQARDLLTKTCPTEASACLARPSPC